jgi:hypothetical protein
MLFRKGSTCVICADAEATTRDHVPPKAFFKGIATGLQFITVPACEPCNNGSSKLDEQLRLYLSLEVGKPTPAAEALWVQGGLRSLEVSGGLRKTLGDNYGLAFDPVDGRQRDAVWIPAALVEAVIGRIVRGMHFHLTGSILPADVPVSVEKMNGPTDIDQPDLCELREGSIGGDAFRYRWGVAEDGNSGLWVFQFHRAVTYYARTGAT